MRTPDEIKNQIMLATKPELRKEMQDLVWEVIDDILSSVVLADMRDDNSLPSVTGTVTDYVVNHYGIDDGWEM